MLGLLCSEHLPLLLIGWTDTRHAKPRTFLSGAYCKLPIPTSLLLNEQDILSGKAFDEE